MPSNLPVLKAAKELIQSYNKIDLIIDLGSGFGFSTWFFCRNFPSKQLLSIEGSKPVGWVQKGLLKVSGLKNYSFCAGNFFEIPQEKKGCFFAYLYPDRDNKIKDYFLNQCPKGSIMITIAFALQLKEKKKVVVNDLFSTKIYVYEN